MKTKINIVILVLSALVALQISCTKTTGDAYKQYLKGGEIVYPGRADSVIVQSGYKRIQLSVVLGNDPLVNKLRVYWNNLLDSVDVAVDHSSDTVKVIIPNLVEGNYNFVVYTYDSGNHRSVVSNGFGISYGDSYTNSLTNRTIKSVIQSSDGNQVSLAWGEPAVGELGTEVTYIAEDGTSHKLTVPITENATTIPSYQGKSKLTYKSLYKPDTTAFEFFSSAPSEITLPEFERELLKSNFKIVVLPTDVLDGGYGWLENYLWDNNYNPPGFATQNKIPCWFTFDSGVSASVSRFKVWQANDRLYDKESVKTFELYGSNTPAPDGSFEGSWTKIGSYTSAKPSGLPGNQINQADIDFAKAGEEFTAPAGTAKFRYYRFKLLTNWGGSSFMTMEEFNFYTHDK